MPPSYMTSNSIPDPRDTFASSPPAMKHNQLCVCEQAGALVSKNSMQHPTGAVVTGESSSLSLFLGVWCPGVWHDMNQPQWVDEHLECSPCPPQHRYRKAPSHMTLPVLLA